MTDRTRSVAACPALAVVLALWVAVQSEPRAQPEGRGRAVLASALEKQGGRAALDAIRDFTVEAKGTVLERTVLMTRSVLRGPVRCIKEDGRRLVSEAREERQVLIVRGDRGKVSRDDGSKAMSSDDLKRCIGRYYRSTIGLFEALGAKDATISFAGTERIGELEVQIVAVGRPGYPTVSAAIDPACGRILQVKWRALKRPRSGAPPPTYLTRFSDFAPFGGLKAVPKKAVLLMNGRRFADRTTIKVTINRGLQPRDFPVGSPARR